MQAKALHVVPSAKTAKAELTSGAAEQKGQAPTRTLHIGMGQTDTQLRLALAEHAVRG